MISKATATFPPTLFGMWLVGGDWSVVCMQAGRQAGRQVGRQGTGMQAGKSGCREQEGCRLHAPRRRDMNLTFPIWSSTFNTFIKCSFPYIDVTAEVPYLSL